MTKERIKRGIGALLREKRTPSEVIRQVGAGNGFTGTLVSTALGRYIPGPWDALGRHIPGSWDGCDIEVHLDLGRVNFVTWNVSPHNGDTYGTASGEFPFADSHARALCDAVIDALTEVHAVKQEERAKREAAEWVEAQLTYDG